MGLALRLLPFDCDESLSAYAHTLLSCEDSPALFDALAGLSGTAVPSHFTAFCAPPDAPQGREGYGVVTTTPIGEPLTYVLATTLQGFTEHPDVEDSTTNRAIWAYLGCLAPQTKVALFWH
jgi:hypothetical protein